jgi:toxin FitB
LQWHALHQIAVAAIKEVRWLTAHVLAESFSSITRMPPPLAGAAGPTWTALRRAFPEPPVVLSADGYVAALQALADAGIAGGRVYDAIIAATAREVGARLLTSDRRAVATYALMGADYQLVV